eukprot:354334-Chlamydomonas_euryale.AAC.6
MPCNKHAMERRKSKKNRQKTPSQISPFLARFLSNLYKASRHGAHSQHVAPIHPSPPANPAAPHPVRTPYPLAQLPTAGPHLSLAHIEVKALAQVGDGLPAAEAWEPGVGHERNCRNDGLGHGARLKVEWQNGVVDTIRRAR